MLTKVILEGEFAKVAKKKVWMLDCASPKEAIQLISANRPAIRTWIRVHLKDYKICEVECEDMEGRKEKLDTERFLLDRKCKSIRFLPIFTGAGGGNASLLQGIIGAVMVVVGALLWWTPIGAPMVMTGVGLILGAICTALMTPSDDDDDDDSGSNYYFNGAVNTTNQGAPVPLVFGRCRVGSAVISSAINITQA